MGFIIMAAMVSCLAFGGYAGYLIGHDRAESKGYQLPQAEGRHARSLPLRLVPCDPPTDELIALAAAETARFPAVATIRFPAIEKAGTR